MRVCRDKEMPNDLILVKSVDDIIVLSKYSYEKWVQSYPVYFNFVLQIILWVQNEKSSHNFSTKYFNRKPTDIKAGATKAKH